MSEDKSLSSHVFVRESNYVTNNASSTNTSDDNVSDTLDKITNDKRHHNSQKEKSFEKYNLDELYNNGVAARCDLNDKATCIPGVTNNCVMPSNSMRNMPKDDAIMDLQFVHDGELTDKIDEMSCSRPLDKTISSTSMISTTNNSDTIPIKKSVNSTETCTISSTGKTSCKQNMPEDLNYNTLLVNELPNNIIEQKTDAVLQYSDAVDRQSIKTSFDHDIRQIGENIDEAYVKPLPTVEVNEANNGIGNVLVIDHVDESPKVSTTCHKSVANSVQNVLQSVVENLENKKQKIVDKDDNLQKNEKSFNEMKELSNSTHGVISGSDLANTLQCSDQFSDTQQTINTDNGSKQSTDKSDQREATNITDSDKEAKTKLSTEKKEIQSSNKIDENSQPLRIEQMQYPSDVGPGKSMVYDYHRKKRHEDYEDVHQALRDWSSDEEFPTDNTPRKESEPLQCCLCKFRTIRRCVMKTHINSLHIKRAKGSKSHGVWCQICEHKLPNERLLKSHNDRLHPKKLFCSCCNFSTFRVVHLVFHQVIYHPEGGYGLQFYTPHWNRPPFRALYYRLRQSPSLAGVGQLPRDPFADSCQQYLDDVESGVKVSEISVGDMVTVTEAVLAKLVCSAVKEFKTCKNKCDEVNTQLTAYSDVLQMVDLENLASFSDISITKRATMKGLVPEKATTVPSPDIMLLFEEMLLKRFCRFCANKSDTVPSNIDKYNYGTFLNIRSVSEHIFRHMNIKVYLCEEPDCAEWCAFSTEAELRTHTQVLKRDRVLGPVKSLPTDISKRKHILRNKMFPNITRKQKYNHRSIAKPKDRSKISELFQYPLSENSSELPEESLELFESEDRFLTVNPDRSDDSQSFEETRYSFYLYIEANKNPCKTSLIHTKINRAVDSEAVHSRDIINSWVSASVNIGPLIPIIGVQAAGSVVPVNVTVPPSCSEVSDGGLKDLGSSGSIKVSTTGVKVVGSIMDDSGPTIKDLPPSLGATPPRPRIQHSVPSNKDLSSEKVVLSSRIGDLTDRSWVPSTEVEVSVSKIESVISSMESSAAKIDTSAPAIDVSDSGSKNQTSSLFSRYLIQDYNPPKKCFRSSSYRRWMTVVFDDFLCFEELQFMFYSDVKLREKVLAKLNRREKHIAMNEALRNSRMSPNTSDTDYSDDPNDPYFRVEKNDTPYSPHVKIPEREKRVYSLRQNNKYNMDNFESTTILNKSVKRSREKIRQPENTNVDHGNIKIKLKEGEEDQEKIPIFLADYNEDEEWGDNSLCLEFGDASYAIDLSFPVDELMLGDENEEDETAAQQDYQDTKDEPGLYTIKNLAKHYTLFQPIKDEKMDDFNDCINHIKEEDSSWEINAIIKVEENVEGNQKLRGKRQTARKSVTPWTPYKVQSALLEKTEYLRGIPPSNSEVGTKILQLFIGRANIHANDSASTMPEDDINVGESIEIKTAAEISKAPHKRKRAISRRKERYSKPVVVPNLDELVLSPGPPNVMPVQSPRLPSVEIAAPSPLHPVVAPLSPDFSTCLTNKRRSMSLHQQISWCAPVPDPNISQPVSPNAPRVREVTDKMSTEDEPYGAIPDNRDIPVCPRVATEGLLNPGPSRVKAVCKQKLFREKEMSHSIEQPFSPNLVIPVSKGCSNVSSYKMAKISDDIGQPFSPNVPQVRPVIDPQITKPSSITEQTRQQRPKAVNDEESLPGPSLQNQITNLLSHDSPVQMLPCPVTSTSYKSCEYCNKRFKSHICARIHYWVEHQQLPYNRDLLLPFSRNFQLDMLSMVCPYCRTQVLGDNSDVFEHHILTHLQLLPYICSFCSFPAVCSRTLMKHSCFSQRIKPLKQEQQKQEQNCQQQQDHREPPDQQRVLDFEIKEEKKPLVTLCDDLEIVKKYFKTEPLHD